MKQHEIETIQDVVAKVPLKKLDAFLEDFKTWVMLAHHAMGAETVRVRPKFIWIDDDKHETYIFVGGDE